MTAHLNKLVAVIFLCVSSVTGADIVPFQASYAVQAFGFTLGSAEISLFQDEGTFVYEKKTRAKGLFKGLLQNKQAFESSIFSIENLQIIPREYTYELKSKEEPEREQYFFKSRTAANVQFKQRYYELAIPAGTIDRSSMEVALMLNAHKREDTNFAVIEKGKVKNYTFFYEGSQRVDLKFGEIECERYDVRRSSGKTKTSLCLAKSLNYLPVYVEYDGKGATVKMRLTDVTGLNPGVKAGNSSSNGSNRR